MDNNREGEVGEEMHGGEWGSECSKRLPAQVGCSSKKPALVVLLNNNIFFNIISQHGGVLALLARRRGLVSRWSSRTREAPVGGGAELSGAH